MERALEVACEGTASSFTVRKLSRATLYGSKRRVPVDAEGRPCRAAALTRDGRFLLPRGTTATVYLDDHGDVVERGEVRPARGGQDAGPVPEPRAAGADELLDCTVRQVYALVPIAVSGRLDELLAARDRNKAAPPTRGSGEPPRPPAPFVTYSPRASRPSSPARIERARRITGWSLRCGTVPWATSHPEKSGRSTPLRGSGACETKTDIVVLVRRIVVVPVRGRQVVRIVVPRAAPNAAGQRGRLVPGHPFPRRRHRTARRSP